MDCKCARSVVASAPTQLRGTWTSAQQRALRRSPSSERCRRKTPAVIARRLFIRQALQEREHEPADVRDRVPQWDSADARGRTLRLGAECPRKLGESSFDNMSRFETSPNRHPSRRRVSSPVSGQSQGLRAGPAHPPPAFAIVCARAEQHETSTARRLSRPHSPGGRGGVSAAPIMARSSTPFPKHCPCRCCICRQPRSPCRFRSGRP